MTALFLIVGHLAVCLTMNDVLTVTGKHDQTKLPGSIIVILVDDMLQGYVLNDVIPYPHTGLFFTTCPQ